jgi:cytochrome oxidase Cu insertion factor (SCO1/SenC/PrrC family)
MSDALFELIIGSVLALVLAGCLYLFYLIDKDEAQWKHYKAEHHCAQISKEEDRFGTIPVFAQNGKSFTRQSTVQAGKATYKCNNEEIKIR